MYACLLQGQWLFVWFAHCSISNCNYWLKWNHCNLNLVLI
ncbi:MAG: DUF1540 domain-containing protein [Bacteroidetes bacterium]|nr:DUF1540 domain-containing protein [Bacteroidota bacterium]